MADVDEEPAAGAPGWVVSYADLVTLLLTFFVLLFSMSEIREENSQSMLHALRGTFGRGQGDPGSAQDARSPLAKLLREGRLRQQNLLARSEQVQLPASLPARHGTGGYLGALALSGAVFFAENSAELNEPSQQLLRQLAPRLAEGTQPIEIRGYRAPSALPSDGSSARPWDLAYLRCLSTMEYLVKLGIPLQRLQLAVAGQSDARQIGSDARQERRTARVDVALLPR